jgi:hypothetical protein
LEKLQRVGPSIRPVEWEILYESKRAKSREPARVLKTICGAYEENEDRIRRERQRRKELQGSPSVKTEPRVSRSSSFSSVKMREP